MAGVTMGIHGTVLHDVHRMRRTAINPLFSKSATVQAEITMRLYAHKLGDALVQRQELVGYADLKVLFSAYANDVLTEYLFDRSGRNSMLDDWKRAETWSNTIKTVAALTPIFKQFPWTMKLAKKLPRGLLSWLSTEITVVIRLFDVSICLCLYRNRCTLVSVRES